MEGEWQVTGDLVKNRLLIRYKGFLSDAEMKNAANQIIKELKKLKPGFMVINDISEFKPASPAGLEEVQRAQNAIQAHGAKKIIRIINRKHVTAQMQFDRMGKAVYKVDTATVTSMEEAEQLLESGS
jgi:hypothetical protein